MGERLWDLMRCVDYLRSRADVDPARIGCAGLSLGGEMAMWLGAMDPRVTATVSAGVLTFMDQMELNHFMCWKFDCLRELVDFPDVYALIAPRPLQCQNGRQEPPTQVTPELARRALLEIVPAYRDAGAPGHVELSCTTAHEVALELLLAFLKTTCVQSTDDADGARAFPWGGRADRSMPHPRIRRGCERVIRLIKIKTCERGHLGAKLSIRQCPCPRLASAR